MSQNRARWNGLRGRRSSGVEPLTQVLLAEYVALTAHVRRHRELRQRLLDLLEAGARVESGPLTVAVRKVASRQLTAAKLSALIGADLVETFLENIEPTESNRLEVREAEGGSGTVPRADPGDVLLS